MTTETVVSASVASPDGARRSEPTRLAARLASARRARFVGREAELALFRAALLADESPFAVLFIHGPGGVGKTTLLQAYRQFAVEMGRPVVYLDGRNMEPSPDGFLLALHEAMNGGEMGLRAAMPEWSDGAVLLLDTFEAVSALDRWLRESFLPQLPQQSLVVIAGRPAPTLAWRVELAWSELTHVLALRNLRPEESRTLLASRGVPAEHHAEMLSVTHGHPLALCLLADTMSQRNRVSALNLRDAPDVVRVLLERFVQDVPSAHHRLALEICVMVWATTETLLADVLGEEDAHLAFEWLRSLSFIEQWPQGLFPHDLAREALDADFRWRSAEAYAELRSQLATHLYRRALEEQGAQLQRCWINLLYLSRHNPITKFHFDWRAMGSSYAEPATSADLPAILAMVEAHEGSHSARIARYWWQRQPEAFFVVRREGEVAGFWAQLALHRATPEDMAVDPAVAPALAYVERNGPVRPHEEISYGRFWMCRDAYQGPSLVGNLTAMHLTIYFISQPKLAWSFTTVGDPDYWVPAATMARLWRAPEADFEVGGRRYGIFSHDWRVEPAAEWFKRKVENYVMGEVNLAAPEGKAAAPAPPPLALSEPEFVEAVRQAVRDYTRPDLLAKSPLLRSRLVAEAEAGDPVQTLQQLLSQALAHLQGNPKDEKLYRAVRHTYIEPAGTQEQTAEWLDLPFSTYRNHLTGGLARVAAWLWQRETDLPTR